MKKFLICVIGFPLAYMAYVLIFGLPFSFITWNWSLIVDNIFPWTGGDMNVPLRALSATFAIFACINVLATMEVEAERKQDEKRPSYTNPARYSLMTTAQIDKEIDDILMKEKFDESN